MQNFLPPMKFFFLIIILFFSNFNVGITFIESSEESPSDAFIEDSYVEYQIIPSEVIEGNRVLKQFKNDEKGRFRWTILEIIQNNYTVKLEFDIDGFTTESIVVIIENRIIYSEKLVPYGYWPFWIEYDDLYLDKILNISGLVNSPYQGKITSIDVVSNINGQGRNVFLVRETKTENATYFQNDWVYLAHNGILLTYLFNLDFFLTLNFSYYITGQLKYLDSNIDLGESDQFASIYYVIEQGGWILILGALILIGFILYGYVRKKTSFMAKRK